MAQESSMFRGHPTVGRVLCCKCGIPIVPNAASMCVKCLSSEVILQKVKLRVQKEVLNGAILEKVYIVEYVQKEHMCESCCRAQGNPDQWVASVQVRQHVPLGGLCFIWSSSSSGMMLQAVPLKLNSGSWSLGPSQQLVSHDPKSNNYYYKYTFLVEICPICLEDLIFLPREVATSLGSLHPLVICTQYWRAPLWALLSSRQLVEYMVLDVGTVYSEVNAGGSKYFVLPDAILIKKIYVENCQRKGGKPPELSLPATSSGGHFICSSSPSIFFLGSASSPAVSTGSDLSTEQETAAIVRHSPARTQAVGHLHHGSVEARLQRPLTPRSCRSHYDDLKRRFQRIVGGDGGGAVVSFLFSFYALLRIGLASSFLMPLLCGSCIFFSDSIPHDRQLFRHSLGRCIEPSLEIVVVATQLRGVKRLLELRFYNFMATASQTGVLAGERLTLAAAKCYDMVAESQVEESGGDEVDPGDNVRGFREETACRWNSRRKT
ncbi:60S ribosomal export protein NMD3 [Vitis vinifera]|uniref:60S ribosomal export protein NMD3 n=1 Tax=Vitis vinifera TaxID=29760 RepID=A0A438BZU8_VITVI|nr:60S ribosomal export protein NMD3 [Vitis vinifera]